MLRLISAARPSRLHPVSLSAFATAAKGGPGPQPPPSPRPSKKRKRKSNKSLTQWQGLSPYRHGILRRRTRYEYQSQQGIYNSAVDTILISSLDAHPIHIVKPLLQHTASLSTSNTYQPSDQALLTVLHATVSAASDRLQFSPADIATETFFRLTHAFNVRPTIPLLEALAKYAATDPIVEHRSQRICSILREMRSLQISPTAQFIFRCFETCIAALDVSAAVTIMEYALSNAMYSHDLSPRVIDYYNAVMYAAILRRHMPVVIAAREDLHRNNVATDARTDALLLASYIETSDPRAEQQLARVKPPLPDLVHAAVIRAAGREKDLPGVLKAFHKFEEDLQNTGRRFDDTLSPAATTTLSAYGALSEATLAYARADPTMSTFRALRTCGAAEEAAGILLRVKERYGYQPSKVVYSTIIETAWKAGKMPLAQKLRREMQGRAAVGYTAAEKRNVGAHVV